MSGKLGGKRVKTVKRRLADGSVKEYRYDLQKQAAQKFVADQSHAIHKIALAYMAAPEFRALSPSWKQATRAYIAHIEDVLGWMSFGDLGRREVRQKFYDLRDSLAGMPVKSDRMIGVLKVLISFGYERAMIDADHARGIPRLTSDRAVRSDRIFGPDDEARILAIASPALSGAVRAALYSAARVSDLIALKWSDLNDGWLTFRPAKTSNSTGAVIALPVYAFPPLKAVIDQSPRLSDFILTNHEGKPWKRPTLNMHWSAARAKAGIEDLHWHDWRGTAVTRMLEAGCTPTEVAGVTGHALVAGAMGKYAARTRPLALNAYTKWWAAMQPGKVVEMTSGKRAKKTTENGA